MDIRLRKESNQETPEIEMGSEFQFCQTQFAQDQPESGPDKIAQRITLKLK